VKAVILAAGYATRLYPLTRNFPKPLLEVGGKTILDHLLDQIEGIQVIDAICLVTNSRFSGLFSQWARNRPSNKPIAILDDGTNSNQERLGALGDLQFAIQACNLDDDLLVCAADNILRFPLPSFVAAFLAHPVTHLCARVLEDLEARRRTGIVVLAPDNRVLEFQEKPQHPKSNWAVPPLYLYPKAVLPRIKEYIAQGHTLDAPGHFIQWLCQHEPVYAHKIEGAVIDIGNRESLAAARKTLA
jgi:glucose-1-phosphate thymidylyltransferase